jgi:regulator of protease activity HflC (stomatin/prohibitin superfamily)
MTFELPSLLFYTVPQAHCVVIERFGKFSRVQSQGLRVRLPLIERFHVVTWTNKLGEPVSHRGGYLIALTEQQMLSEDRECITRDNVPVTASVSVYWRITDPRRAIYEVANLPKAVEDVALNALRSNVGTLDLDRVLSERASLNEHIAAQLSETGGKWGVVFTRVEIRQLETKGSVASSMLKQMDSERERRARVTEALGEAEAKIKIAEAEKQVEIKRAEAGRQALVLRAEGEAQARAKIAQADAFVLSRLKEHVGESEAVQILLAQKFISGLEVITKQPGNKVFVPNSFQGLLNLSSDTPDQPKTS